MASSIIYTLIYNIRKGLSLKPSLPFLDLFFVNRRLIQLKNLVIMANGFKRKKSGILFSKGENEPARKEPNFVVVGNSCTMSTS